jgi:hypothetical protein
MLVLPCEAIRKPSQPTGPFIFFLDIDDRIRPNGNILGIGRKSNSNPI